MFGVGGEVAGFAGVFPEVEELFLRRADVVADVFYAVADNHLTDLALNAERFSPLGDFFSFDERAKATAAGIGLRVGQSRVVADGRQQVEAAGDKVRLVHLARGRRSFVHHDEWNTG